MAQEHFEYAKEVQNKLEFYFVALSFTSAAFAIQSGNFSGNFIPDFLEFISWVCFFITGLLGLSRLEYVPVVYHAYDSIQSKKQKLSSFPDGEYKDRVQITIEYDEKGLKKIESGISKKYKWQKLVFCIGIGSILMSRMIVQVMKNY